MEGVQASLLSLFFCSMSLVMESQCCLLPRFEPGLWEFRWREEKATAILLQVRKGDSGVCLFDSLPFRVFCRGSERCQDGAHPPRRAEPYCPAKLQPPLAEATVSPRHHSAIFTCLERAWRPGSWVFPRALGLWKDNILHFK